MLRFPVSLLSLLFLQLESWLVLAQTGRLPHYTMDANNTLINVYNDRYVVKLMIAETPVYVLLDTGSTDIWVNPPAGLSGPFTDTGVAAKLAYGDGSSFVNGTIGLGQVEFAGFTVPAQAFINVTQRVGHDIEAKRGIHGLVGLGFDSSTNPIPYFLNHAGIDGSDIGKSILSSIFDQNPDKGRFFSMSLSRLWDANDSAEASLFIGGYDDNYAAVQYAPMLPQYPPNTTHWTVLTDGFSVGGVPVEWPSYDAQVPAGQNVVDLDTGTTNFEVRDAIYSAVPGAVLAKNSSIPNSKDVWIVPCTTAVNLTTKFGGQEFPIHPLDITDLTVIHDRTGTNYTVCVGSITNGGPILGHGFDALYGDTFLRNVYTVFSFGNDTTPPFVQLLSQTDPVEASADFAAVRAELLGRSPPELSPQDIINIFDGAAVATAAPTSDPVTMTPVADSTPVADPATPTAATDSSTPTAADSSTEETNPGISDALGDSEKFSANLADNIDTDSALAKYGPIIIGLLGANLVVLLVLVFLGVMSYVRAGRRTGPTRALNPQYTPVKVREDVPRSSFSMADHVRYSD
ncbi:aspartic peptidase domain-containing protein [Mycena latifolia]|nr:aspartic peptidase domain-containing protein [Mycena latifolia]